MTDISKGKITLLTEENNHIVMNLVKGTMGETEIDIRHLGEKGYFTFDPGFTSTASCISNITYIDGNEGILLYRGYPIDQLVTKSNYLEVCYILLNGEIPTSEQFKEFCSTIFRYSSVHENIPKLLQGFCKNSHPMAIMCGIMSLLAAFYYNSDITIKHHRETSIFHLLSKIPSIAAMCYKYSIGQKFIHPRDDLSYINNFLNMMFTTSFDIYETNPILERALDQFFILHADHEQNISTTAVRTTGSSGTNLFACIMSGIISLWGPYHGGANESCLEMLEEISITGNIQKFINRAKDKNDPFRLSGFGHRVYKNYDPRAIIMREICYNVLKKLNLSEELLEIALELENFVLRDSYFVEHKLYPNIDFYSGIFLKSIGIPSNMFTLIFAIARSVGWAAHWKEMHESELKIVRPRQLYLGYKKRDYP